jgi:hypothetical protein
VRFGVTGVAGELLRQFLKLRAVSVYDRARASACSWVREELDVVEARLNTPERS